MSSPSVNLAALGKALLVRQLSSVHDSMSESEAQTEADPLQLANSFGVVLGQQPSLALASYSTKIPAVLVALARSCSRSGGFKLEGVFRISPDMTACKAAREALNQGQGLAPNVDAYITSALIKDFFRTLPESLLSPMSRSLDLFAQGPPGDEQYVELFSASSPLPEPNRSILLWLFDVLALVLNDASVNRMSSSALAVVFAPSLYYDKDFDMASMQRVKLAQIFIEGGLSWVARCKSRRKPF